MIGGDDSVGGKGGEKLGGERAYVGAVRGRFTCAFWGRDELRREVIPSVCKYTIEKGTSLIRIQRVQIQKLGRTICTRMGG